MVDQTVDSCYRFGPFVFDPQRLRLWCNDETIQLPHKAFDVLAMLLERHGEVVTKDELLARVWPHIVVEENNLPRQISTLRKALSDTREHHEYIATIPGQGYRFVAPIERGRFCDTTVRGAHVGGLPPAGPLPQPALDEKIEFRAKPQSAHHPHRLAHVLASAAAVVLVALPVVSGMTGRDEVANIPTQARQLHRLTYGAGLQHQPAWSPDGHRIAFTSDAGGNTDVWVQEIGQLMPARLTTSPAPDWQPAWSPDGRWIAFRSERDGGGLYVMPSAGGDVRRVTTFGYRPKWSSSGTRLLFSSSVLQANLSQTWVVDLRGGEPRLLRPDVMERYGAAYVAWRPDVDLVSVWGRERDGGWSFVTMSIDAGESVRVSQVGVDIHAAIRESGVRLGAFSWAPSGTFVYFEGQTGDVSNLWRVPVDPRTLQWLDPPERLTIGAGLERDFSIAPDGRRIAFSSLLERTRLWALGLDSEGRLDGRQQALTSGSVGEYDAAAPRDGLRLAFRTSRGGQQQLWERSILDGAERVLLAGPSPLMSSPRWSSDGRTLAYARRIGGDAGAIGLFDAATGEERVVGVSSPWSIVPDDWSRDGATLLAACRQRDASHNGYATCLVTIGAETDDARVREIASDPSRSLICQRFSPDERWISFMAVDARRPDVSTLYIMPAQGGGWTAITEGRSYDDKPRWSADGRFIYFISDRGGSVDVWGQRIDKGAPVGEPFRVTEFDEPSLLVHRNLSRVEIAVSEDRLFLPLTETAGDIWMLEVP
jgi:Tol biopolymer transport system component/DNA-binding winged helix-turn-helix (wHTH) protein